MSKYEVSNITLAEQCHLIGALRDMGYESEIHTEGAPLVGYQGDERPERAHVIIRRRQLDSASNDIGFARDGSGVYRAIISGYDRSIGVNDAWLGRLAQCYKERQTMAVAKAKGYVFRGREVIETPQGRKIQLRFAVR